MKSVCENDSDYEWLMNSKKPKCKPKKNSDPGSSVIGRYPETPN